LGPSQKPNAEIQKLENAEARAAQNTRPVTKKQNEISKAICSILLLNLQRFSHHRRFSLQWWLNIQKY